MSVDWVRREFAERWVVYVEQVATSVDTGRSRLRIHHFELVFAQPAVDIVPLARTAAERVLTVLDERVDTFAVEYNVVHSGPAWELLRAEYLKACEVVRAVCTSLMLDVELLLHCNDSLPQPTQFDFVRLYSVQRNYLRDALRLLDERTGRFLNRSQVVFVTGRQHPATAVSTS